MEYRPQLDRKVDAVWLARVKAVRLPSRAGSPSIHALDGLAELDSIQDASSPAPLARAQLAFDSRSPLPLAAGERVVLALAQGQCIGIFPMTDGSVWLPSQPALSFGDAATRLLGQTLQAVGGDSAEIAPASDWVPDPKP